MTAAAPRICCLDLDTFFVSVERVMDPSLEGKPVIVGGRPGSRGVVTACSYEVRASGVRSGMSLTNAGRLAPDAVHLPVRHDTYGEYAKKVREIAADFTPVLQVASIDEMYMDFAGCERMYRRSGDADDDTTIRNTVERLTREIKAELGLPSSAGIATSPSMAKVASGLAKPAGVMLVTAGTEAEVLAPLPVRKLPGIGPVAAEKLGEAGIERLGQIATAPANRLKAIFGAWAEHVQRGARGEGSSDLSRDRPTFREHDIEGNIVGSISNERTFKEDTGNPSTIDARLCSLAERVCWRARKRGVKARTVTLKMRYADFETLTRARTIHPTCSEFEIYPVVHELYTKARTRRTPIRLLGIQLSNLGFFDDQLGLFEDDRRRNEAVDSIREKFGYDAVWVATSKIRDRQRSRGG
ncbi:MAG: DNA polymerase IV [Acidobacteriota bacterium]|nr:DNA polymerase IV [Acidobacteriota bacterium]